MNKLDPKNVRIKQNPNPKERYELTFTIHDAPGPFDSADADIHYEVSNEACVPTDAISGAKSKTPNLILPIPLTRISDTVYRGEVALDLPVAENYFGLGVCHWMVHGAGISLKIQSAEFGAGIGRADIEAQNTVPSFLWKEYYIHPPMENYSEAGVPYSVYSGAPDRTKYFSIDVAARKAVL
ncbi:hypothetical protein [Dyella sp. OK004]|uniref:hypothetical protein n=1 Tax=Dyella sp. OK004 TaxID=1855292 RepID=UPI0011606111|nr:hypothetical protein [Dyella sp. OK004]